MKRKILNVLFALVLVLSFTLVVGTPAAAATINVPGDQATIQAAIDAAVEGDIIVVAAGTYTEDLVVNTNNITLMSAAGAATTIIQLTDGVGIDVQGGASLFTLGGASGQGFTINSSNNATGTTTFNVQLANAPAGVTISHNTIDTSGNATMGISVGAAGASGLTISNNTFTGDSKAGGEGSIWGPDVVDVTVTDNTFTGLDLIDYAVQFSGVTGTSVISGNTITDYKGAGGIVIGSGTGVSDLTINGNTISGCAIGIRFYDSAGTGDITTVTVNENTLTDNAKAIRIGSGVHIWALNFVIEDNNISGSTTWGLQNEDADTVTAENNWWGAASGPTHASNPTGTGDAVTGNIDFVPWLDAAYPAGEPSGYPVYNVTQGQGYETITEAVDAADPGDTITVAAGEYEESFIYINKSLTLLGAGADVTEIYVNGADYGISVYLGYDEDNLDEPLAETVVIDGFYIYNASSDLIWLEEVNNGSSVTISNNDLDGNEVAYGIYCGGTTLDNGSTVTITGNYIYNCAYGIYFQYVSGGSALNIIDNYIYDNSVYGVYIDLVSEDSTVTMTGNTVGSWYDAVEDWMNWGNYDGGICFNDVYDSTVTIGGDTAAEGNVICSNPHGDGIQFDEVGNSIVTIEGNQICDNGWDSYWGRDGIDFYWLFNGSSLYILNNDILENTDNGIQIEGVEAGSTVVINFNSIVGNEGYGVDNRQDSITFDARYNWWGNVAGPFHEGSYANPYQLLTPTGDSIHGWVNYSPWMIQSELAEGWNIWSRPIVPDEDSWEQMQNELVEAGIESIYYFDSATQLWGLDPDAAGPMDAFYIKMADDSRIRYYFSAEPTWPPLKAMKVGWNFIGLNQLYEMDTPIALLDIYFGTGGAFVPGYSKVICPSLNGASWTYLPDGDGGGAYMYPIKGYWVFMVNNGVLGGFTTTPIVEIENT